MLVLLAVVIRFGVRFTNTTQLLTQHIYIYNTTTYTTQLKIFQVACILGSCAQNQERKIVVA